MPFLEQLKKFKKSWDAYEPLITIEISRQRILDNLQAFQIAYAPLHFAPVLKSNAYGHGLIEVASILDNQHLPFFMVDSLFEAKNLRRHGITTPLLVLGYTADGNIASASLKKVAFGISSLAQLKTIDANLKQPTSFHIKIDTGMHRQGLHPSELLKAIKIIKDSRFIEIQGLCSHLADADGPDQSFSAGQIKLWNEAVKLFEDKFGTITYKHLTNSAGADLGKTVSANVGRLGLGLYGFNASPRHKLPLQPVLAMHSVISSVRTLAAGEKVGYNGTFTAEQTMQIATVPVGYYEGLDRRLSNIGALTIGDVACAILGRVSMNMVSVNVSHVKNPHANKKVLIFSSNPNDANSIQHVADLCQTITYDILVKIPAHLRRVII